jgi:hypothetical protein
MPLQAQTEQRRRRHNIKAIIFFIFQALFLQNQSASVRFGGLCRREKFAFQRKLKGR